MGGVFCCTFNEVGAPLANLFFSSLTTCNYPCGWGAAQQLLTHIINFSICCSEHLQRAKHSPFHSASEDTEAVMMRDLAMVLISAVSLCQSSWDYCTASAQWDCSAELVGPHQSGQAKFDWLQQWSCWTYFKWRRFACGPIAKINI